MLLSIAVVGGAALLAGVCHRRMVQHLQQELSSVTSQLRDRETEVQCLHQKLLDCHAAAAKKKMEEYASTQLISRRLLAWWHRVKERKEAGVAAAAEDPSMEPPLVKIQSSMWKKAMPKLLASSAMRSLRKSMKEAVNPLEQELAQDDAADLGHPDQQPLTEEADRVYQQYKDDESLPIEVLLNYVLLLLRARRVIQIDMNFYRKNVEQRIQMFVDDECTGLGSEDDSPVWCHMGGAHDLVLCLAVDWPHVEQHIKDCGGYGSKGYARLLDPTFYSSEKDVREIYDHNNLSQVSINAIRSKTSSGALLVQMLDPSECENSLPLMYARFVYYKELIAALDDKVQCTFNVYAKSGSWKAQPTRLMGQMQEFA